MQARPPETIEKRMLVSAASTPASTFPSVGAAATCANSIPVIRPRSSSGVATSTIVLRRTALTKSAAPATASSSRASQSAVAKPNATSAAPHAAAATTTPRPCLRTRASGPEKIEATSAPAYGAA